MIELVDVSVLLVAVAAPWATYALVLSNFMRLPENAR